MYNIHKNDGKSGHTGDLSKLQSFDVLQMYSDCTVVKLKISKKQKQHTKNMHV